MNNHNSSASDDGFDCGGSVDSDDNHFWINDGAQKVLEWDAAGDDDENSEDNGDNQQNEQFLEQVWKEWEDLTPAETIMNVPCFDASDLNVVEEASRYVGFKKECRLGGVTTKPSDGDETATQFAQDASMGYFTVRSVQVKALQSVHARRALQDVVTEVRVLSCLAPHPNFCSVVGRHKELLSSSTSVSGMKEFFYVTNGISSTLEQKIAAWKSAGATPVDLLKRLVIAVDIAGGLAHLHANGIVSYVRPDKIGFDLRTGRVQIFDLGQARRHHVHFHPTILTMTDNMDVIRYMAPECFYTGRRSTCDVDAYAFGILVWEMVALRVPFEGFNRSTHFDKVACHQKRPQTTKESIEHKELAMIIHKAWHPSKRSPMAKIHKALIKFIKPLGKVKRKKSFRGLDEAFGSTEAEKKLAGHSSDTCTQTTEQSSLFGEQSTTCGSSSSNKHRTVNKTRSRSRGPSRSKSDNKLSVSNGDLGSIATSTDANGEVVQDRGPKPRSRSRGPSRALSCDRLGFLDSDIPTTSDNSSDDLMQNYIRKAIETSEKLASCALSSSSGGVFLDEFSPSPNCSFPPASSTHSRNDVSGHSRQDLKKNLSSRMMQRNRSMAHGSTTQLKTSGRISKRHSCVGHAGRPGSSSFQHPSSLLPQENTNDISDDDFFQMGFPEPQFGDFDGDDKPSTLPVRRVKSSDDATLKRMRRASSSRLNTHFSRGCEDRKLEDKDVASLTLEEVFSGKQATGSPRAKTKSSKRGRRASMQGTTATVKSSQQKPKRMSSIRRLASFTRRSTKNDIVLESLGKSPAACEPEPTLDQLIFGDDDVDDDAPPPARVLTRTSSDQSHARARKVEIDKLRTNFDIGPDNLKRTLSNDALTRLEVSVKNAEPIATPKKWQGLRSLGASKPEQPTSNAENAGKTPLQKVKHRRGSLVASLLGK